MQLTIYVPGLLLPPAVLRDTVFDLSAPALSLLLGRGTRDTLPPNWLARAFNTVEPLPVAALRKVGAGGTAAAAAEQAPDADWLGLDPVHWSVTREGITLDDPLRLQLDPDEADRLCASLAPLFADWGALSASSPGHWELHLSRPLSLDTCPLPEACGCPVDPALPGGPDGRIWRSLLAEAQTLLHTHPVNRQREALGRPTINSLWPWGTGRLPSTITSGFDVVWATDPVIAGLAARAGKPCLWPPESFQPASGKVLIVVDSLLAPARTLDALAWRQALLAFDRDWITPALTALKQRGCTHLQLIGVPAGGDDTRSFGVSFAPHDRLRFWRRPRPLTDLS